MKKSTYIIIGLLLLVVVFQIILFCMLRASGIPWDEYWARFNPPVERVETVAEEVIVEESEKISENFVTSLEVPGGEDIEVVIRVKNPEKLRKDPTWRTILQQDTINANTLLLNVGDDATMKVEILK